MIARCLVLAALVATPALAPAQERFAPDSSPPERVTLRETAPIPFVESGLPTSTPLPVIMVMVNGRGPFRFGVETGAGFVAVSQAFADSLGLRRTGGPAGAPAFRLDSISMPGATFAGVPVTALPNAGTGVSGILGLPFWSGLLLTIDYPARVVRLARGDLPAPDGREVLPLTREGPFWALPITFGNLVTRAIVDTRSTSTLGVTPVVADSLAFTGPLQVVGMARGAAIGPTEVRAATLDGDVRVGKFSFPRPTLSVRALPAGFPQLALFGSAVMQHFTVTIDQRNARIRLTRSGPDAITLGSPMSGPGPSRAGGAAPASGEPRRVGIAFAFSGGPGGKVQVNMVVPGSLGERAGLRAGDVLLELDGKAASTLTEAALGEILRAWREVPVVVERDGQRVALRLPER